MQDIKSIQRRAGSYMVAALAIHGIANAQRGVYDEPAQLMLMDDVEPVRVRADLPPVEPVPYVHGVRPVRNSNARNKGVRIGSYSSKSKNRAKK